MSALSILECVLNVQYTEECRIPFVQLPKYLHCFIDFLYPISYQWHASFNGLWQNYSIGNVINHIII